MATLSTFCAVRISCQLPPRHIVSNEPVGPMKVVIGWHTLCFPGSVFCQTLLLKPGCLLILLQGKMHQFKQQLNKTIHNIIVTQPHLSRTDQCHHHHLAMWQWGQSQRWCQPHQQGHIDPEASSHLEDWQEALILVLIQSLPLASVC